MVARCLSCRASIIYVPAFKFFPTVNKVFAAVRVWKTFLPTISTTLTSTSWLFVLSALMENSARDGFGKAVMRSFILVDNGCEGLPVAEMDAPGHTGPVRTILLSEAIQFFPSLT